MASLNLSYEPVEALANSDDDWPGPRCAHTLTPIFVNNSPKLVLFGGTNVANRYSNMEISAEGVTNAVHIFDVATRRWSRLNTCGDVPCPRACHAAATVGTYLLIQGGTDLHGDCDEDEDVYALDIASVDLRWRRLYVEGVTPGPRYGHVMGIVSERWLVIFGGATETEMLSDTWAVDLQGPAQWHILNPVGNLPSGRMYGSACVGQQGVFWLFGGIDSSEMRLGDTYELTISSITECRWTANTASVAPSPRCQHSAVYDGTRMIVIGGVVGYNDLLVDGEATVAVLNTETSEWLERNQPENSAIRELQYQRMRRCFHAAAFIEGRIYVYGGRRLVDELLGDFLVSEYLQPPAAA